MPTFSIETLESRKPFLLLSGSHPLSPLLLAQYKKHFKIVLVSENAQTIDEEEMYIISSTSLYLIDKLVETIEYAVIFLTDASDKTRAEHILAKCRKDETKTALIVPYEKYSLFGDLLISAKNYPHVTVLFLGDVFGSDISIRSRVSKNIQSAVTIKSVELPENDVFPVFCISQNDALSAIDYSIFAAHRKKSFYLFYEHPQTLTSVVHLLSRIEPELSIHYSAQENTPQTHEEVSHEISKTLGITPCYMDSELQGFEKSLESLDNDRFSHEERNDSPKKVVDKSVKKTKKRKWSFLLRSFSLAIVLFFLIHILLVCISLYFLKTAAAALEKNDLEHALSSSQKSIFYLRLAKPGISLFPLNTTLQKQFSFFEVSLNFLGNSKNLTILQNKGQTRTSDIQALLADIVYLFFRAQETKNTHIPFMNKLAPELSKFASLSQILPDVLGFFGQRDYLLLFQNNAELRPTGGFIGSLGEATFVNGKYRLSNIKDVYDYDGQLKVHVEPHYIVRRYLQPHLYLRDSNFDPDFENSASMSALLYNLSGGKKVHGVIAVDFEVFKRIIHILGPLKLFDYNKVITEENALEFLQETIHDETFAGSTTKKDLLAKLMTQITIKLEDDPKKYFQIAKLLPSLFEEKHILFASNNPSVESAFVATHFAGGFADVRLPQNNSIHDTLSINEANIGVNKENTFIDRAITYDVYLDQKEITSKVSLSLKNKPEGRENYRAYIRVLVPFGSTLTSISFNHIPQPITPAITNFAEYEAPQFRPPEGLEVDTTQQGVYQTFGFIINIDPGRTQTIEVSYKNGLTPQDISLYTYSLLFFKQPGTLSYPFRLVVHYPSTYIPRNAPQESSTSLTTFDTTLTTDKEFALELRKRQ